ncbi:flippase-like domain-containing protein [Lacibacter luteus]|uniref:Flippase-like domain-containing protein n=1 Tax=Lacibacter luteus TaxID=2508719 RepID=A0A4Q1CHZ8_9BACT|nr:flippase-like domain-containing protein [Lacibacter luteus]
MILEKLCKEQIIFDQNKQKLNRNFKIIVNYFLGPVLFVWISVSLYNQVKQQPDLPNAWLQVKQAFYGANSWMLWLGILLMPVNWGLEAYKWYLLVNKLQPFSFSKAYESVLSGLSLAMNTPNRVGEYGGRIVYLQPQNRLKGVALTLVSSVGQLLITLVCGLVALLLMRKQIQLVQLDGNHLSGILLQVFLWSVLFFIGITALFFFRMQLLAKMLQWIPWLKEKLAFATVLDYLNNKTYYSILFYSFLRFVVFALQYVLIWQALRVNLPWWEGFWSIALIFLVMAIVPSFAIADVGIRGKVAIAIIGVFSANTLAILAGSVLVWLLNLVLPALVGSLLLLSIKIFKER